MKAEYRKEPDRTWLILEGEAPFETESYQVRMLMGNMIPSVLRVSLRQVDGVTRLCYDTGSRRTLADTYGSRRISGGELCMILENCVRAAEEMRDFLLDADQLILKPEFIFTAAKEERLYFCCNPAEKEDFRTQLRELAEYFLPRLDHNDPQAVTAGYQAYRCITGESFSLDALRKALYRPEPKKKEERAEGPDAFPELHVPPFAVPGGEDLLSGILPEEPESPSVLSVLREWIFVLTAAVLCAAICGGWYLGLIPGVPQELLLGALAGLLGMAMMATGLRSLLRRKKPEPVPAPVKKADPVTDISDFPGYEAEEEAERTEMILPEERRTPVLISEDPAYQDIPVEKEVMIIGKLRSAVDAVIPCPTVSRVHARIVQRDAQCFLTDLNSRNGTYVNDRPIAAGEETPLAAGDRVRFAAVEYRCTLP